MEISTSPKLSSALPLSSSMSITAMPILDLGAPSYNEDVAEERRKRILTKNHSISEKMELYNSSTKGSLKDL